MVPVVFREEAEPIVKATTAYTSLRGEHRQSFGPYVSSNTELIDLFDGD